MPRLKGDAPRAPRVQTTAGDEPRTEASSEASTTDGASGTAALRDAMEQGPLSANALSAQAAEILATTTQQATGATEQSAAVSQATTTVDEIKTIAEQLVTRSQSVADSAQRTVEVSRTGQEVSCETIAGMAQIKTRVDVIEENILALSERTLQIGEIARGLVQRGTRRLEFRFEVAGQRRR